MNEQLLEGKNRKKPLAMSKVVKLTATKCAKARLASLSNSRVMMAGMVVMGQPVHPST